MALGILSTTLLTLFTGLAIATPLEIRDAGSTEAVSTLSTDQTNAFVRPARFTQVSYCSARAVLSWKCGPPCDALPGIEPIAAGGNDAQIPGFFIVHDPTAKSIVVAHQGTNPINPISDLNDLDARLEPLDQKFFPGASADIKTHNGFSKTFSRTANQILANVTSALQSKGVNLVEIHGHSLGGAIAVMDAVFLRQHLNASIKISATVFALPRSGNKQWADFVDKTVPGLVHIHNKKDIVGILPSKGDGFQHPSGEIHIQDDNSSLNCPGQENKNSKCLSGLGLLKDLIFIPQHFGPYYSNISMSAHNCPL